MASGIPFINKLRQHQHRHFSSRDARQKLDLQIKFNRNALILKDIKDYLQSQTLDPINTKISIRIPTKNPHPLYEFQNNSKCMLISIKGKT